MKANKVFGSLTLLVTALIWGSAFVAQSAGMEYVGPFTFQTVRSLIGGAALLPLVLFRHAKRKRKNDTPCGRSAKRRLLCGGILCGTALCIASCFQQIGILYTTVGKAGFITALYIIFVPLLGIFFKRKPRPVIWLCVVMAVAGLYLLCVNERLSLSPGDALVLVCALCFSVHIMLVDAYSDADGVDLACIQFFVSGVLASIPMLILERPTADALLGALIPILYAGLLSSGVGYTLQIIGQKYTDPAVASLLMSLESVFAVLTAALVLHEIPTLRESVGCIVMFSAILLAQLPDKKRSESKE